jgi:peroxiredoxin
MSSALMAALEEATRQAIALDAPMAERLDLIADRVRSLSGVFADAVDGFVGRLKTAGAGEHAPAVGTIMPPFILPDDRGRLVTLAKLSADGPVAIVFLRGHWCPYCQLTAAALQQAQSEVESVRGKIVVITPELQSFARMTKAQSSATYPILIDMDNGYAMSLNLAIWVDEAMSGLIASAGWNIPSYQGNGAWMLPIPATFVVAQNGMIVARFVDPDYRRRMDLDELVQALRASHALDAAKAGAK